MGFVRVDRRADTVCHGRASSNTRPRSLERPTWPRLTALEGCSLVRSRGQREISSAESRAQGGLNQKMGHPEFASPSSRRGRAENTRPLDSADHVPRETRPLDQRSSALDMVARARPRAYEPRRRDSYRWAHASAATHPPHHPGAVCAPKETHTNGAADPPRDPTTRRSEHATGDAWELGLEHEPDPRHEGVGARHAPLHPPCPVDGTVGERSIAWWGGARTAHAGDDALLAGELRQHLFDVVEQHLAEVHSGRPGRDRIGDRWGSHGLLVVHPRLDTSA